MALYGTASPFSDPEIPIIRFQEYLAEWFQLWSYLFMIAETIQKDNSYRPVAHLVQMLQYCPLFIDTFLFWL